MSETAYPRHVYQRGGVFRIIADEGAYHQASADGWTDLPSEPSDGFHLWDGAPLLCEQGDPEIGTPEPSPKRKGWPKGKPRKPVE